MAQKTNVNRFRLGSKLMWWSVSHYNIINTNWSKSGLIIFHEDLFIRDFLEGILKSFNILISEIIISRTASPYRVSCLKQASIENKTHNFIVNNYMFNENLEYKTFFKKSKYLKKINKTNFIRSSYLMSLIPSEKSEDENKLLQQNKQYMSFCSTSVKQNREQRQGNIKISLLFHTSSQKEDHKYLQKFLSSSISSNKFLQDIDKDKNNFIPFSNSQKTEIKQNNWKFISLQRENKIRNIGIFIKNLLNNLINRPIFGKYYKINNIEIDFREVPNVTYNSKLLADWITLELSKNPRNHKIVLKNAVKLLNMRHSKTVRASLWNKKK